MLLADFAFTLNLRRYAEVSPFAVDLLPPGLEPARAAVLAMVGRCTFTACSKRLLIRVHHFKL